MDLSTLARQTEKKISILIPSRYRPDLLKRAIDALISTAKNKDQTEILVRLDNDDTSSFKILESIFELEVHYIIGPRYLGYASTGVYFNELAALSKGEFIFLCGDDLVMKSQDWDDNIIKYSGNTLISFVEPFPIISRNIYEALGYIAPTAHPDGWIRKISIEYDFKIPLPIEIVHDRWEETGNNKDTIYEEKMATLNATNARHWELVDQKMNDDLEKVRHLFPLKPI